MEQRLGDSCSVNGRSVGSGGRYQHLAGKEGQGECERQGGPRPFTGSRPNAKAITGGRL